MEIRTYCTGFVDVAECFALPVPGCLHRRTRAQFAAQLPGFTFKQQADDMEYKTLIVPPLGEKEPAPYFTLFDEERNAFFVCARDVVAGGRTRGVYVLNKGGFANLETQNDYYKALQKSFPAPFSEVSDRTGIAARSEGELHSPILTLQEMTAGQLHGICRPCTKGHWHLQAALIVRPAGIARKSASSWGGLLIMAWPIMPCSAFAAMNVTQCVATIFAVDYMCIYLVGNAIVVWRKCPCNILPPFIEIDLLLFAARRSTMKICPVSWLAPPFAMATSTHSAARSGAPVPCWWVMLPTACGQHWDRVSTRPWRMQRC